MLNDFTGMALGFSLIFSDEAGLSIFSADIVLLKLINKPAIIIKADITILLRPILIKMPPAKFTVRRLYDQNVGNRSNW